MLTVWYLTFVLWGGQPGYQQPDHQFSIVRLPMQTMAACQSGLTTMRFPPQTTSAFRDGQQVAVFCRAEEAGQAAWTHYPEPEPTPPSP